MKNSIVLNISGKKKYKPSKGFLISLFVVLLVPSLFVVFFSTLAWTNIPDVKSNNPKTEEVFTVKEDKEVVSGFKEEITEYVANISANLTLVEATYYVMEMDILKSKELTRILQKEMSQCSFAQYSYLKEDIPSEELRKKITTLEESTRAFCNVLLQSTSLDLRYYDSNDAQEKFELYEESVDLSNEAYDRGIVIQYMCEEIIAMVGV